MAASSGSSKAINPPPLVLATPWLQCSISKLTDMRREYALCALSLLCSLDNFALVHLNLSIGPYFPPTLCLLCYRWGGQAAAAPGPTEGSVREATAETCRVGAEVHSRHRCVGERRERPLCVSPPEGRVRSLWQTSLQVYTESALSVLLWGVCS